MLHVAQPTEAGVAVVVAQLAADQVRHGLDVHVACPEPGRLAADVRAAGAVHHAWAAGREPGPAVPGEARRLAALIRRVGPDVVHLHSSKAGLAGRLVLRGRRPTVFTPHAWSFLAATGAQRRAAVAWERLAARWTHALVAVSEAELAAGRAAGIGAPGHVVPNGVDLGRHTPWGSRADARAALGLAGGPLAVCVGRLSEQKGQDLLLAAWAGAPPPGRLVLVGDGPAEGALRAVAPPGVVFAGAVDDPRPWYAAADVVVVPSRWEGMALVPLEAMAAGRPVVAFDVAGVRESVPPGCGAVVPAGHAAELVGAVADRLRDPGLAAREGAAAREHVAARHDAAVSAARVRELYTTLLGAARQ